MAEVLYRYLQRFINTVDPWISTEDIAKGTLWRQELADILASESVGVLVVNKENVASPWVNYEAGALSKSPTTSRVIPFLFQMRPSALKGPFEDLNAASFVSGSQGNADEFKKLLKSINDANAEARVPDEVWRANFDLIWPQMELDLNQFAQRTPAIVLTPPATNENITEVLDNLVEAVRDHGQMLRQVLGDERWTFRGNAKIDPLSRGEYRDIAMGLEMLKTLAEIEKKGYAWPVGGAVSTLLRMRDPLEVLLACAYAPIITSVYFEPIPDDPEATWTVTYREESS